MTRSEFVGHNKRSSGGLKRISRFREVKKAVIYQAGFLQFLSTIFSAGCEACSDDYSDSRLSVNEKRGEDRSCWMDEAASGVEVCL